MAKKNNSKNNNKNNNRSNRPGGGPGLPKFSDLTTDRFLASQKAKVEKLLEAEEFDEALETLEVLTQKYPNRAEVFELLGATYVGMNYLEAGRDAFERVLELSPKPDVLTRFNLANLYALTGYPLLAYEQTRLTNMIALNRELGGSGEADQFVKLCEAVVDEMVAENKLPRERFMAFGLPVERGQLALQRNEPDTARPFFEEALKLEPNLAIPHNSLGLTEMVAGNYEAALTHFRYVLDKLDANDLDARANQVRTLLMKGDRAEAQTHLAQLSTMPAPTEADDLVKLAMTYALFDDDQKIYDLMQPLLTAETQSEDEELEGETLEDAVILGAVSATHLGRKTEALSFFDKAKEATGNILLERIGLALTNNEVGPRSGERFHYFDPATIYAETLERFRLMLESDTESETVEVTEADRTFLQAKGDQILDMIAYQVWTTENPEVIVSLLMQVIDFEVPGGVELVKNMAFGRAYTEPQRLIIASSMVIVEVIDKDTKVTMWLKGMQFTDTLARLAARFQEMEGLSPE